MAEWWTNDPIVGSAPATTAPVAKPAAAPGWWENDPIATAAPIASAGPDPVGQGLSGVNEGVAGFLSLPNTVEKGLRSIGPAIGNALGGDFDYPQESWLPDAGASFTQLGNDIGAIKPETDNPADQFARRVGQEVGAAAIPVAGGPAKVVNSLAALGSGIGAATAQELAPGNALAELAGQVVGGGIPIGFANQAQRASMQIEAPTLEQLERAKTAAYAHVDDLGAQYSPQSFQQLVDRMERSAIADDLMPEVNQRPAAVLAAMRARADAGFAPTLTQLDKLRQMVGTNLLDSSEGGDRFFGRIMRDEIDDFIQGTTPSAIMASDPTAATAAIQNARQLHQRFRKTETLENKQYAAEMRTASTGSGGNINNATRQRITDILLNANLRRQFSPDELEQMETLVRQGPVENALRQVGKVAPGGNGLMTALNIGAVANNPVMAAVPIVGTVAKSIADRGVVNGARQLRANIASGGRPDVPLITPETESNLMRLATTTTAANQNYKGSETNLARLLAVTNGR